LELNAKDSKGAARTLAIFEAFARAGKPLTLTELSRELEIPLSSCLNLMQTLVRRGYAYSLGIRRGYYPSVRMKQNSEAIARHDPLLQHVGPALEALRTATRETVLLAQRVDDRAIILDIHESPQHIRYAPQIGEVRPLHSTAIGKALLGAMEAAERTNLLSKLKLVAITPSTVTDAETLAHQLLKGKADGWYRAGEENMADLLGISAPVDLDGQVFAIAVAGPIKRMEVRLDDHVMRLLETVRELCAHA
jgi:IclR family transcriptional regulator, acetate operon repressor